MAKKKTNNILMIAIMIAVVILFLKLDWTKPTVTQVSQFADKEKANTVLGDNLATGGAVSSQINLCDSITPYVVVFNLQNLCVSNGGTWTCNSGNIGCSTLTNPIIDCNSAAVKTAISQCVSSSGKSYCDTNTLSCKY